MVPIHRKKYTTPEVKKEIIISLGQSINFSSRILESAQNELRADLTESLGVYQATREVTLGEVVS